jgi:arylsulfatase A-like enzyme
MIIKVNKWISLIVLVVTFMFYANGNDKPNILFILTDNQGPWTLGCYGNPDFLTPNIDHLAMEGVRFENAFSNNPVCSPTRATYLTGLTPSQHGVHRFIPPATMNGTESYNTIQEFRSLPEILAEQGYYTGLVGKWHLGQNREKQEGFSFWVTKPDGHTPKFMDENVVEDGELKPAGKHLTAYFTDRAEEFLETAAHKKDQPFFLYLTYNGPYGLSSAVQEPVPSPWSDPYINHPLPSLPRPGYVAEGMGSQGKFIGDVTIGRNLAGQVTAVDDGVGRVLRKLKQLGLEEDTLVIFAADQGAVAGQYGYWGMGDHANPQHLRDGTLQVPLIFRWPNHFPSGETRDQLVTNYDFLPTLLELVGLDPQKEISPNFPGRPYSKILRAGGGTIAWEDVLYAEFENVRAIRTNQWKLVKRIGEEPNFELYNLRSDPGEQNNLANLQDRKTQNTLKLLGDKLDAWFDNYNNEPWNLWRNGDTKGRKVDSVMEAIQTYRMNRSQ